MCSRGLWSHSPLPGDVTHRDFVASKFIAQFCHPWEAWQSHSTPSSNNTVPLHTHRSYCGVNDVFSSADTQALTSSSQWLNRCLVSCLFPVQPPTEINNLSSFTFFPTHPDLASAVPILYLGHHSDIRTTATWRGEQRSRCLISLMTVTGL